MLLFARDAPDSPSGFAPTGVHMFIERFLEWFETFSFTWRDVAVNLACGGMCVFDQHPGFGTLIITRLWRGMSVFFRSAAAEEPVEDPVIWRNLSVRQESPHTGPWIPGNFPTWG